MSDVKDPEHETKTSETTSETPADETAADEGAEGQGDEADDAESEDADSATPEAIARRVAALGEEDEIERLARQEEAKLAERRASKKKGKKTGLEVAASKKLAKIGTRAEPRRTVAVAAEADPLIERTEKLSEWAKKNQKTVQIAGAVIAAGLLGLAGYLYFDHKKELEASVLLTQAVADERARIGEPPKDDEESDGAPVFKTYDARREAALGKYRDIEKRFPGTGAAILARLSEGSLLLDKRDPNGAAQAFADVKGSPLAAADQEVKGRALEGIGFASELEAQKDPATATAKLDDALKSYKELENTVDVKGFKELAMYHQARVLMTKGDKDKAKEILVTLKERMSKPEEQTGQIPPGPAFPYLSEVAMDRLREIDPAAAPKQQGGMPGGGAQITQAQIRKMMEEAQKKGAAGGHGGR